jgi:NADPH2:quinone reductase
MTQGLVIPLPGAAPELRDIAVGANPVELVAAELMPLDLQIAAGRLPSVNVKDLRAGQVAVGRNAAGELLSVQGGRAGLGLGAPNGTFSESFEAGRASAVLVPTGLDPLVAAAGVSSVIAARLALEAAQAEVGDVVLVVGARGAVGSAAASLARSRGCEVVEVTRDDPHAALAAAPPADVVVDCVGGPLLADVIRASGARARHVLVGYVGDGVTTFALPLLLVREHRLMGLNVYATPEREFEAAHVGALADLAAGRVDVPESRLELVALSRAAEAYAGRRRVLFRAG